MGSEVGRGAHGKRRLDVLEVLVLLSLSSDRAWCGTGCGESALTLCSVCCVPFSLVCARDILHLALLLLFRVGQLASSRADILPREVVEELSLLQDRVPGFGYPAAARIIEEELGAPVPELFAWFDTVPLAAASLSQVHRARLWGGEEVVVKVQRPRLAALFELDLQALRGVAQYLQRSKKYGGSTRDWIGMCRTEAKGYG